MLDDNYVKSGLDIRHGTPTGINAFLGKKLG